MSATSLPKSSAKSRSPGGGESGFTLLETIIAIAIMVVAFAAILSTQSESINASIRARQMNVVGMLAKNRMVQTEYDIEGKTFDEVKKEETGNFDAPYQDYRWKTEIKEIEFPSLNFAAAAGDSSSQQEESQTDVVALMTKLVTQFLSKAVREVTVTISWTKGKGEQSFSVSTYWVDLNHEFQLSQ